MPLATEAQLCNQALSFVGERQFIDSLEQATASSRVCKQLYAPTRDAVLAACWWSFATKRVLLAETLEVRDGWTYAYAAPADMLDARYIYAGVRNPPADSRIPFDVELNDAASGRLILTDEAAALLCYTKQLETVVLYPPLFVEAVAWALAVKLALALPVKPAVGLAMRDGATRALASAMAFDKRQGREDPEPESAYVRSRG